MEPVGSYGWQRARFLCGVAVGMLLPECHKANDTPSSIFRIVACRLNCTPTRRLSVPRPLSVTVMALVVSDTGMGADPYQHTVNTDH